MTDKNHALGAQVDLVLGPAVPQEVMTYLHAYGDSRADDDGLSGLRISEAILALRRWSAAVQAAERERCAQVCEQEHRESGEHPEMALHCAERIRGLRA